MLGDSDNLTYFTKILITNLISNYMLCSENEFKHCFITTKKENMIMTATVAMKWNLVFKVKTKVIIEISKKKDLNKK